MRNDTEYCWLIGSFTLLLLNPPCSHSLLISFYGLIPPAHSLLGHGLPVLAVITLSQTITSSGQCMFAAGTHGTTAASHSALPVVML